MNQDLSIHRMAFREAPSLGVAQALVVKKRQDLELRMLRERVLKGTEASGSGLDAALRRMEDEHRQAVRHEPDQEGIGAVIDKTA